MTPWHLPYTCGYTCPCELAVLGNPMSYQHMLQLGDAIAKGSRHDAHWVESADQHDSAFHTYST